MIIRTIKRATVEDVKAIHDIIRRYANKGWMLYRHPAEIERNIRDYFVYRVLGEVSGCVGLRVWDRKSAEIYALAVSPDKMGSGIGTRLIKTCIKDAKKMKVPLVFTLTYRAKLFQRLGFEKIRLGVLPRIIFTEKTVDIDKAYGIKIN